MNESARDARGAGLNVLGILAQAAFPAFHVQLARYLGAGGYGLYTWSATFVDLFSVVTLFGCDQAVMRQVSLARARGESSAAAVGTALRIVVLSGILVVLGIYFAAPAIASLQHKPGLVAPLRCLALVPFFYHIATELLVATQALHVMRWAFWARNIVQPIVLLGTTSVALRVGLGPAGAATAVVIGMAATAVVACVFYARELPLAATLRAALSGPLDRGTLRIAVPLVLANLLLAFVGRVDSLFLGHYGNEAELGAYAACVLYAASITQVRGAFDPVASALVAPALAKGDTKGLSVALQRQTRWVALAAFPIAGLFVGFGEPLLRIYGHGFSSGVPALAALAVGHAANSLALSSCVLPLSGNARMTTYVAIGTLVLQTSLCALLVPRHGPLGAAIALAAGLVCTQAAQLVLVHRVTGVRGISVDVLWVLACAAASVGIGRVVFHAVGAHIVVAFFVGVAVAATAYVASAWMVAMTKDDRDLLRALVKL